MNSRTPPAWVPPEIRDASAGSIFMENADRDRWDRLVSSRDMKPVWEWLKAKSVQDKDLPMDFLVMAHAIPNFWKQISKTPTKKAMGDLKRMEVGARQLARQLREREGEIRLLCGYDTGLFSLIAEMHRRAGRGGTADQLRKQDDVLYLSLGERLIPDLADVLESLAEKLERAEQGQLVHLRPTKPNEASAERTYCVQFLADFLKERTGEVPKSLIARAATEVLDLAASSPMTASHVRQLLKR